MDGLGYEMKHYWWVNHSQTFQQEIMGQYLWSPKTEAHGVRSHFYENMCSAVPGDLVLSFANTKITYVGVVLDFAISAPKPSEFGSAGANWSNEGWLLPVTWTRLETAVSPAGLINDLRPVLPSKYSPIHPLTGRGNQKAYLSEVDRRVVELMIPNKLLETLSMMEVEKAAEPRFAAIVEQLDDAVEASINSDTSLADSERSQVIQARRGQGAFRQNVVDIEHSCRLTGVTNRSLLIASHIKPWRSCANSRERLDGHNGLLLAPHVDLLFDRGLISFSDDGGVLLSHHLQRDDLERLGLQQAVMQSTGVLRPEQREYMRYHRSNVYLRTSVK
jgi:putative restriction endonuclease